MRLEHRIYIGRRRIVRVGDEDMLGRVRPVDTEFGVEGDEGVFEFGVVGSAEIGANDGPVNISTVSQM